MMRSDSANLLHQQCSRVQAACRHSLPTNPRCVFSPLMRRAANRKNSTAFCDYGDHDLAKSMAPFVILGQQYRFYVVSLGALPANQRIAVAAAAAKERFNISFSPPLHRIAMKVNQKEILLCSTQSRSREFVGTSFLIGEERGAFCQSTRTRTPCSATYHYQLL